MMNIFYNIGTFVAEKVNVIDLGSSFKLMGQGMLGIFVVMAAIALTVYLITKIPTKK